MKKKIIFLSFVAPKDIKFLWEDKLPASNIANNEEDLFEAVKNFTNNNDVNNDCFKKVIWPEGDPWKNVSDFLDNII